MAKKKVGFYLPLEIIDRLNSESAPLGEKRKWQLIAAALAMYFRSSVDDRQRHLRMVHEADGPGGSFEMLIRDTSQVLDSGHIGLNPQSPKPERGGRKNAGTASR